LVLWLLAWAGEEIGTFCSLERSLSLGRRQACLRRSLDEEVPEVALKQHSKGRCTIDCGNDWLVPEGVVVAQDGELPFQRSLAKGILLAANTGNWVCWEKENSAVGRVDVLAI
jgi:hypothetical protein